MQINLNERADGCCTNGVVFADAPFWSVSSAYPVIHVDSVINAANFFKMSRLFFSAI